MGASLCNANLHRANLRNADLSKADLSGADLSGVDLHNAKLSGAELLNANLICASIIGADLSDTRLLHAFLSGANLYDANLSRANLGDAKLNDADLAGANLIGTNLHDAFLGGANLSRANLSNAVLIGANLHDADFSGADLYLAQFGSTTFGETNLSTAKNLENCRHVGRSYVDFLTLMHSKTLPEVFLRGCGLSDELIIQLPSLRNRAMEYYSCFISYSTKDQEFAERLYVDLQNKGVRCWFAPHDVQGGRKLHEQIDEAIRMHDKLLLVLSDASMESEWVKTEIAKARTREIREKRRMLFPVRLVEFARLRDWECFDADTGKDSAKEIREYYVPDFSNWKDHDSYQKEFSTLLKALKNNAGFTGSSLLEHPNP